MSMIDGIIKSMMTMHNYPLDSVTFDLVNLGKEEIMKMYNFFHHHMFAFLSDTNLMFLLIRTTVINSLLIVPW